MDIDIRIREKYNMRMGKDGNHACIRGVSRMYIHLTYYSGDRSLVENILKNEASAIVADKVFYLDAADNDGDALRFRHNNGSHFDVVFLEKGSAQQVYAGILDALRDNRGMLEMDIREQQTAVFQES